jgi:hypothetical protein
MPQYNLADVLPLSVHPSVFLQLFSLYSIPFFNYHFLP